MSDRELILAHFSIRNATFDERVEAAAAAGFDGIGLNAGTFPQLQQEGWTVDSMQARLDDVGIAIREMEALRIFDTSGAELVFELVEAFRPLHVQVIAPFDGDVPIDEAGERFAALCQRAQPYGTNLAFEFLPFTPIRTAAQALAIIEAAGNPPNGGLCVDSWHVFRGVGLDQLAVVPPERVAVVQLDDGPMIPVLEDYLQDTLHYRDLPGEGEFDLVRFLRALPAEAPLSLEVIDDDLDLLPPAEAVALIADATRRLLAEVETG